MLVPVSRCQMEKQIRKQPLCVQARLLSAPSFSGCIGRIPRCFSRALISRFDMWIQISFVLWQIYMLFPGFVWRSLLSGCYSGAKVALWRLKQPGNPLLRTRGGRDIKSHLTDPTHRNLIHILSAVNLIPQHFLG